MKAEINKTGELVIIPESVTEDYALDVWFEKNVDKCNLQVKLEMVRFDDFKEGT